MMYLHQCYNDVIITSRYDIIMPVMYLRIELNSD